MHNWRPNGYGITCPRRNKCPRSVLWAHPCSLMYTQLALPRRSNSRSVVWIGREALIHEFKSRSFAPPFTTEDTPPSTAEARCAKWSAIRGSPEHHSGHIHSPDLVQVHLQNVNHLRPDRAFRRNKKDPLNPVSGMETNGVDVSCVPSILLMFTSLAIAHPSKCSCAHDYMV